MSSERERLTLLVAEDDPFQRKILSGMLARAGYEVEAVESGEEALMRLPEGRFQILITDWDMPGMDGETLCRRVRDAKGPGYLYILMLTAHTSLAHTLMAFEAGADDYIKKPADETELLARVKAGQRIVELERSLSAARAHLERLSLTDALLGCYNRRYFNEQLPREIERAYRYGTPLALAMADLDGFKQVNDVHGHMVGDEVLVCFVERAAECLRASDWIARFGGEEFAIVLPETRLDGAQRVAEKIRARCAATPIQTIAGELRVTVSLGAAGLTAGSASTTSAMTELLSHADSALYKAKRAGRNRVTVGG